MKVGEDVNCPPDHVIETRGGEPHTDATKAGVGRDTEHKTEKLDKLQNGEHTGSIYKREKFTVFPSS